MQPDARMEGRASHLCGARPAEVADSLTTGGFREAGLLAVVPVPGFWDTSGQYPLSVSEGDCTSTPVVARLCSQVLKFDCQASSAQPVIKFNSRVRESLAGARFLQVSCRRIAELGSDPPDRIRFDRRRGGTAELPRSGTGLRCGRRRRPPRGRGPFNGAQQHVEAAGAPIVTN